MEVRKMHPAPFKLAKQQQEQKNAGETGLVKEEAGKAEVVTTDTQKL